MSDGLDTPWSRARKTRSRVQEESLGRQPGGTQQPASGRFWNRKRDGVRYEFLIEARTNEKTSVRSYRISYDEFKRIAREAQQTPPGLVPAMQIQILDLELFTVKKEDFFAVYERMLLLEAQVDAIAKREM